MVSLRCQSSNYCDNVPLFRDGKDAEGKRGEREREREREREGRERERRERREKRGRGRGRERERQRGEREAERERETEREREREREREMFIKKPEGCVRVLNISGSIIILVNFFGTNFCHFSLGFQNFYWVQIRLGASFIILVCIGAEAQRKTFF